MNLKLDWSVLWGDAGALLLQGLGVTLHLSFWSLMFALMLGVFFGVLRWLRFRFAEPVCAAYVEFVRNTPALVQILFWYFSAAVLLPPWLFRELRELGYAFGAAVVAISVYHGAFFAEIVRASLRAVPAGQYEAGRVLGLSFRQIMTRIMLPQAFRVAVLPLVNEVVSLIKNTSLAMAIGVAEITYQYKAIDNFQFRGIEALTAITVIYFLCCIVVVGLGHLLNRAIAGRSSQRQTITSLASE